MVREIDCFKEKQVKEMLEEQKHGIHYEIASQIFLEPQYRVRKRSYGVDVFIDLHPEEKGIKSLPPAVEIYSTTITVLEPKAYPNSRRMAKDLEKRLGREVWLKTTYDREQSKQNGKNKDIRYCRADY